MSRNLHWQIPFKSLSGQNYTVKIYDEGWTGNATTLTGSANPFEIQEDDNEDFFTPVRYQSGYFRIECADDTWKSLIPSDDMAHKVELYKGNSVVWWGFQKAESFTHNVWQGADEYEFPICCPLTMLKSAKWELASGYNTIAELIAEMFAMVELTDNGYIEYPGCYYRTDEFDTDIVGMKLSRLHFLEFNDDYLPGSNDPAKQKVWKQKKTPAEVLESICRTLGWCCHYEYCDVCFSALDVCNTYNNQVYVPVQCFDVGSGTYTFDVYNDHTILNSDICRADNEGQYSPAYGDVLITADPDEEDVELSLPSLEDLLNRVDFYEHINSTTGDDNYTTKYIEFGIVEEQQTGPWIAPGIWSQHFKKGWIATQHDVNEPIGVPSESNDGEMDSSAQDWYDGQDTDDRYDYDYDWDDGWDEGE